MGDEEHGSGEPAAKRMRPDDSGQVVVVSVKNLPRKWLKTQLVRNLLVPLNLQDECTVRMHYVGCPRTLLQFRSQEAAIAAADKLNAHFISEHRQVNAKVLQEVPPMEPAEDSSASRSRSETVAPLKTVEAAVAEWQDVPYEQQLQRKRDALLNVLRQVTRRVGKGDARQELEWARKWSQPCCPLDEVVPSPRVDGYRNKVEFTLGIDVHGRRCVGFNLGRMEHGVSAVGDPSSVKTLSPGALWARNAVQRFLEESPLDPYEKSSHSGAWRILLVRTNEKGHIMMCLQYRAEGSDSAVLQAELDRFRTFLGPVDAVPPAACPMEVVSVYTQRFDGVANRAPFEQAWDLLAGSATLEEELLGCTFTVSPNSFFQVNTLACAELFRRVREAFPLKESTTLLDLYSGTGLVGITLARSVGRVIGVEMVPDAVADAQASARRNGLENTDFRVGLTESVLEPLLREIPDPENVVAVVDPARAGLHVRAVRALRYAEDIRSLIYVSCNQNSFIDDCERLCKATTKAYGGRPFRPIRAFGVDLFPHTSHVELVCLLIRDEHTPPSKKHASKEEAAEPELENPASPLVPTESAETMSMDVQEVDSTR